MKFVLIVLGCLLSSYSYGAKEVHKCVSSTGQKYYSARPCAEGYTSSKLNISTGSTTNLDMEQKQLTLRQQKERAKLEREKQARQERMERQTEINKEAIAESEKNKALIKDNPKQFSPFAIPPYEPGKLSNLVRRFQERLSDIERMRRTAAEKALATGQCGRVESSELDIKSTSTLLSFLVDCSSGKSFYYTELDFLRRDFLEKY